MSDSSLAENLNNFAFKLFRKLSSDNENLFVSPFSISTALLMCYIGARNETAKQLKELLSLTNFNDKEINDLYKKLVNEFEERVKAQDGSVALKTANKLFLSTTIEVEKDYLSQVESVFNSTVQNTDFSNAEQAAKTINDWVASQTNDMIKNLVDPSVINALVKLILVNAIYFKGTWVHVFDEAATTKKDFHLENGSTKKVDMMRLNGKSFRFTNEPNGLPLSTCTLPYKGNTVSMTIFLPHENVKLSDIENRIDSAALKSILSGGFPKVNVELPKFKFESQFELSEQLGNMGATDPFDERKADFSGINKDLFISKVIHKAVIDVNEKGTEAAAATAVVMMLRSAMINPEPPKSFVCDRPFMFILHDSINLNVLFVGKYVKPQE